MRIPVAHAKTRGARTPIDICKFIVSLVNIRGGHKATSSESQIAN